MTDIALFLTSLLMAVHSISFVLLLQMPDNSGTRIGKGNDKKNIDASMGFKPVQ